MSSPTTRSSRRRFLQHSALFLGSATALPQISLAQAGQSRFADPDAPDYWQSVRAQFSFGENTVPMNAANLCPSFQSVSEAVAELTADIDKDCSFNNRAKFAELLEQTRTLVAAQLNVSSDEIALVRNTSEANNIVNNGLQLDGGDEVILWDQNHPTNHVAWEVRAARFGTRVRKVSTPDAPTDPQQLLAAFVDAFGPRTRVLALTHVSNVSGVKLPVKEIIAAAHARGIYVHVDGAQSWGAMALDLQDLGADSFTASAHKWYLGPKEVGLLYVRMENIDRIWPSVIAPGWGDDIEADPIGARKFESLGQRDDAALAALGATALLHDEIGPQRIEARISELAQRLKNGIRAHGLQLVTPMDAALSHGVCIARAPAGQGGSIANRLYTEHGIAIAATGGVRLCPTIYNTEAHIDRAITGLAALMA